MPMHRSLTSVTGTSSQSFIARGSMPIAKMRLSRQTSACVGRLRFVAAGWMSVRSGSASSMRACRSGTTPKFRSRSRGPRHRWRGPATDSFTLRGARACVATWSTAVARCALPGHDREGREERTLAGGKMCPLAVRGRCSSTRSDPRRALRSEFLRGIRASGTSTMASLTPRRQARVLLAEDDRVIRTLVAPRPEALDRADWEAVRVSAHSLKSSSATIGGTKVAEAFRTFERELREHRLVADPSGWDRWLRLLGDGFESSLSSLTDS